MNLIVDIGNTFINATFFNNSKIEKKYSFEKSKTKKLYELLDASNIEKILTFTDFKLYLEQYWRAHEMEMENIQTGKSTTLSWNEYKFRVDISERDFTPQALERLSR